LVQSGDSPATLEEDSLNAESWITDERRVAEAELLALLENEPVPFGRRQESMAVAGLESIVAMIMLQAVTGVASGFAGKLLYRRWRESTTRRKLNDLASQIPLVSRPAESVDEDVIRRDVVEVLMLEGLNLTQAEYLTERIVARVKSRAAGESPREPDPDLPEGTI
jgi:hypothetical protein